MFTDTFKFSAEPVNRLNKLVMDTYQGVVDAQMASLRGYMELLEEQTKSAAAIRDFDGIKSFVEEQPERFNQLVKKMSDDVQQFAKVAEDFRNEASELLKGSVATEEAQAEEKPAAKAASASQKKTAAAS